MTRICLIGAGSLEWSQLVITDLPAACDGDYWHGTPMAIMLRTPI
jgi:hypothetical protein